MLSYVGVPLPASLCWDLMLAMPGLGIWCWPKPNHTGLESNGTPRPSTSLVSLCILRTMSPPQLQQPSWFVDCWTVTFVALWQYNSWEAAIVQNNFCVCNSCFELFPKPFFGLLSVVDNLHTLWVLFLEGEKDLKKDNGYSEASLVNKHEESHCVMLLGWNKCYTQKEIDGLCCLVQTWLKQQFQEKI